MRSFTQDPGTIKVDWALSGPIPWLAQPTHAPGTFHIADSVEQMGEALSQVAANLIPAAPFMLAGQMTTADPTRSPPGTESVWAYTHVPQRTRSDAGGEGLEGRWDYDECQRFADRMQARIEASPQDSVPGSWSGGCSDLTTSRPATPTWSVAHSVAAPPNCTRS